MKWPDPLQSRLSEALPDGYTLVQLSRLDVPKLVEKLPEWYPNISHGDGARFTRPKFYFESVSLKYESSRDTIIYVGLKGVELVSMVCLERDYDTKSLYGRLGVVAPEHRRSGLGVVVMDLIEASARLQGLANIYTYATLHNNTVQKLLEKAGYSPVGIVPGRDRECIPDRNEVVRVPEVLYVKALAHRERSLEAHPANMTPAVKRIWQTIKNVDVLRTSVD
ncbi:GNAT family N-acetyltransferase [Pseudomonas sp. RC10]|uniref:GNAT family N-acetyltransferase n=1 Tax=Pseudomonas bambusae TaxID=3139142 RepID=UPI00313901C6